MHYGPVLMRRKRIYRVGRWCAALVAIALAGCNAEWMRAQERTEQAYTASPISYRADILAFMRTYLNDPVGVRDAGLTEPAVRTFDSAKRWTVCVRYNARRSNNQYAGPKDSLVLFSDGRLDRVVDNGREFCRDASYLPFPELERLTR
jgi:hypothetical protein